MFGVRSMNKQNPNLDMLFIGYRVRSSVDKSINKLYYEQVHPEIRSMVWNRLWLPTYSQIKGSIAHRIWHQIDGGNLHVH